MNRVLSRATKLSKIIGKSNFLKANLSINLKALQTSSRLINISHMNYAENERGTERRFEKFSDSSSVINNFFFKLKWIMITKFSQK